jgi:hypothetical protein
MAAKKLYSNFVKKNKKKITEDDPQWMKSHGPGYERKVGGNVTVPRAYVKGGSKRGRRA